MISCEDAMRELWGYLENESTPAVRRRMVEHLEACRRCCGELAFLRELRRFVAAAQPRMPADVGARMEEFLARLEGARDRPDVQG